MVPADVDLALRREAMAWLEFRTQDGLEPITWEELREFTFRGEKRPLKDRQLGIYKPRGLEAALSITTTFRAPGRERPYEDRPGEDGLLRYKWQGENPDTFTNRGLRIAMERRLPLIWFWGVAPGVYKTIFPVYLVAEEPAQHQFVVATDGLQNIESTGRSMDEITRRYALEETRRRLHQPVFRSMVMQAYRTQCAVCRLRHARLLDAAHIVADSEDVGIAAVRNGLAMCKIHHAAYDTGILGVSPDYIVSIREDILDEVDGPILEHGLKRLHGEELRVIPTVRAQRPDRELLARHFEEFRAATTAPVPRVDIAFGEL